MDVVKSVLERLKGSVSIRSIAGKGTTFYLKVPLTLAIIKALLFRVGERLYAVPLTSVAEIIAHQSGALHRVDGHDVMQLRGEVLTLLHLHGWPNSRKIIRKKMFVVVISTGERKFGWWWTNWSEKKSWSIKAIDDHLVATDLVSGASILGDGTVVLILNLSQRSCKARQVTDGGGHSMSQKMRVLVVDDSALMRKTDPTDPCPGHRNRSCRNSHGRRSG